VIEDELRFNTNGNEQHVDLIAWGQNAHFHGGLGELNPLPSCDEVWTNDLPHVIYGIVEVEPGCTLTIEEGTQVHVHDGSGLLVYQSTLNVAGELGNEVVFQGDRLESSYEDVPGQWGIEIDFQFETEYGIEEVTAQRGGIWLYGGVECTMDYAVLKNGTIGLQVDTTGTDQAPALDIRNTVIHNMSAYGLYAQGGTIEGYNNLFYDCGQSTAAFTLGGAYKLDHCTFANYWSEGVRQSPSVLFTDWYEDINGNIQVRSLEGSAFNNCIFWGNNYSLTDFDELVVSLLNPPASPFIRYSAVDVQDPDFPTEILEATLTDNTPPFASTSDRDFHLSSNNSLWDGGASQFAIGLDLDGLPRAIGQPDMGCYERQQ
ncbi:MAG: right-handed parallel beta-helix repeat-containing protein, partial [Flavobacteriales bacterium]